MAFSQNLYFKKLDLDLKEHHMRMLEEAPEKEHIVPMVSKITIINNPIDEEWEFVVNNAGSGTFKLYLY